MMRIIIVVLAALACVSPAQTEDLAPGTVFRECPTCPEMVVVPAGRFLMGSPEGTGEANEHPQREITVPAPFAVGRFEITRGEFAVFAEATGRPTSGKCWTYEGGNYQLRKDRGWWNPGFAQSDDHPAVCIGWFDARDYTRWLAEQTGQPYRLLSESEWEYVARAGSITAYSFGDTTDDIAQHANCWTCGDPFERTSPVGALKANAFGLYDVHGNAWEWVQDCYFPGTYLRPGSAAAREDWACSSQILSGFRVLRGGSWYDDPGVLRSAFRGRNYPANRGNGVGFRVARTLSPPTP